MLSNLREFKLPNAMNYCNTVTKYFQKSNKESSAVRSVWVWLPIYDVRQGNSSLFLGLEDHGPFKVSKCWSHPNKR